MRPWLNRSGVWLERDDIALYLLVLANVLVFGWCVARAMPGLVNGAVLFQAGALAPLALSVGERWRLVAYGFLHLNPLHLGANMLCLVVFGRPLIRRVKTLYFVAIYLASIVAGGIASIYAHEGSFLAVGASGGISGVLGALVGLWVLGKPAASPGFLVANIGLNVLLSRTLANVDWWSHLGGFIGGLIACAVLDLVEKLNGRLLQCKFPEFVKTNGAVLLAAPAIAVAVGNGVPSFRAPGDGLALGLIYAAACLAVIKLADLVLPLKKGLATVILALALGNAALVWAFGSAWAPALSSVCRSASATLPDKLAHHLLCQHPNWIALGAVAAAFLLTLLMYAWDLRRGLNDVGFVGATLKANRHRSQGL
jgi:membrane associated rhomboid family serine protease